MAQWSPKVATAQASTSCAEHASRRSAAAAISAGRRVGRRRGRTAVDHSVATTATVGAPLGTRVSVVKAAGGGPDQARRSRERDAALRCAAGPSGPPTGAADNTPVVQGAVACQQEDSHLCSNRAGEGDKLSRIADQAGAVLFLDDFSTRSVENC